MGFEIISNDLKCILFEKYGFLFLKSPIHVYQYEMPVSHGSAILSLTQECILSLCLLHLTLLWTLRLNVDGEERCRRGQNGPAKDKIGSPAHQLTKVGRG
jgi:hypothetical protein